MSVETGTGNGPETGLHWGARRRLRDGTASASRAGGACRWTSRRRARARGVSAPRRAVSPLAAGGRRGGDPRRVRAAVALFSRRVPLQLTWESMVGVPLLLVGAKLLGLYDRDETLLHKTTLDEAPELFQLATLCALVAWLAGGLVVAGTLDRSEALLLWLVAAGCRSVARATRASSRCGPFRPSAACSSATKARRRWSRAS